MATDMAADDHATDRSSDTNVHTESPDNYPIPGPVRGLASPPSSAHLLAATHASAVAPNTNGTFSNNNNNNSNYGTNHGHDALEYTAAADANNNNNTIGGSQVVFLDADIRTPRDGRVRSAVPSKLKNVKRDLNKSFAVMQMDVSGGLKSAGRDAAAKRVSESTALQAKLASTPSYVSHHRRANWSTPPASTPQPAGPPPPLPPPGDYIMLPLNAQEIKSEQARLLTLLRTLPPATVVDQFCKALAFFGGVPEAPPPADGRFPESEEANGPGSLFVGWVSEIFPNLERPRQAVPRPTAQSLPQPVEPQESLPATRPTAQPAAPSAIQSVTQSTAQSAAQPMKRPRGRPKGSKASKARSDKGIKKGPLKVAQKIAAQAAPDHEDSWVDEDTIVDSGKAASTNGDKPPTELSLANNAHQAPGLVAMQISMQSTAPIEMPSKKRGRPKGSKNRPKEPASVLQAIDMSQGLANRQSEQAQPASSLPTMSTVPEAPPTAVTAVAQPKSRSKAGTGATKPPAQRRKKDSTTANPQGLPETVVRAAEVPASRNAVEPSFGANTQPVQSGPSAPSNQGTGAHTQTQSVKESKIAGKRKRQSMPTQTDRPNILNGVDTGLDSSSTPASITTQSEPAGPPAIVTSTAEKAIQVKRARKGNAAQASLSSATVGDRTSVGTFNATETMPSLIRGGASQLSASGARISDAAAPQMAGASTASQAQHVTSASPQVGERQQPQKTSRSLSQSASAQRPNMTNASNVASQQHFQQQNRQEQATQSHQATNRTMYYNNQAISSFPNGQHSYQSSHPPQQVSNGSPATSRGNPHVSNSPHFGAGPQSRPPIVQGDTTGFAHSPDMMHSNAPQAPRRTPSTSSAEPHPYRAQYGARQQSSAGTAPSVSHASPPQQNLPQSFGGYSDPLSFLDQQEDINLNNTPYNLNMDHSQSMARSSAGPTAYSSGSGMNYMSQNTMARANHQNRWQS